MQKIDFNSLDKGVFLVSVLAIILDPVQKKILIGRRENDLYVKELSWTFPGGRPGNEADLENYLKDEVKKKTGVEIEVKQVFFARNLPERREILLVYFFCKYAGGEALAGEKFAEIKWVKPTEVKKYFTTSIHPRVWEFLENLEKGEAI